MFMIRVAMGAVKIRIVPEASVFRGDAYFDGPGAHQYHFWRKRRFLKICFKNIFSKHIFRDIFFQKKSQNKMFPENGVGGNFGFGGRARKITPLIYPLIFKNFFGHENSRRESFLTFSFTDRRHFSSRCRIWGQKWRG